MVSNSKYKVIVSDRAKRMLGTHIRFMAQVNKEAAAAKKKEEPAAAPAKAPAPVPAPVQTPACDDKELAAVIAAAIAASEGTSPDGIVVRSIRKINRKRR